MAGQDEITGGPAFPFANPYTIVRGMNLRDWFAGMALTGMPISSSTTMAEDAYALADEMIKVRNATQKKD